MTTTTPRRNVYSGTRHVGSVVNGTDAWRAFAVDGYAIGGFPNEAEAVAAVLRHLHRAKRSNP